MPRLALGLLVVVGTFSVACSVQTSEGAASSTQNDSAGDPTSTTASVTSIIYSDLGNAITVSGSASFVGGQASLYLRNESDDRINAATNGIAQATATASGADGVHAFQASFNTGDPAAATVPKDGQCIGVYVSAAGGRDQNIGAFSYCPDGQTACNPQIFPDTETCMRQVARLAAVSYSTIDNVVYASGLVSYFEAQAQVVVRNETRPTVNFALPTLGSGATGIAIANLSGGDNGVGGFNTSFDLGANVTLDECVGVYQVSAGKGGLESLGAFRFHPRPDDADGTNELLQEYYFDAAGCLAGTP